MRAPGQCRTLCSPFGRLLSLSFRESDQAGEWFVRAVLRCWCWLNPVLRGFMLFDAICVYYCSAACFVFFHLFKGIVSVVWCWFCVDGCLCACLLIVLIVNYIHCTASIKKVCYMTPLVFDVWIFSMAHHTNSIINMTKWVCVYYVCSIIIYYLIHSSSYISSYIIIDVWLYNTTYVLCHKFEI